LQLEKQLLGEEPLPWEGDRLTRQLCAPSFPALQQPTFMMAASMRLLSDCSAAVPSL